MPLMRIVMSMRRPVMMPAATQEPSTGDIHGQAKTRNRDRFAEMNGDRRKDTAHRFIGDEQGDHREDDRTGESGEVAELARAEGEVCIVGVFARVAISECG